MSSITKHCGCVFPPFSLSPCLLFNWMLLWSGYLFSSAIDASVPDDLRGVGLADFLVRFTLLPCSGSM